MTSRLPLYLKGIWQYELVLEVSGEVNHPLKLNFDDIQYQYTPYSVSVKFTNDERSTSTPLLAHACGIFCKQQY
jgi:hypothetical protein